MNKKKIFVTGIMSVGAGVSLVTSNGEVNAISQDDDVFSIKSLKNIEVNDNPEWISRGKLFNLIKSYDEFENREDMELAIKTYARYESDEDAYFKNSILLNDGNILSFYKGSASINQKLLTYNQEGELVKEFTSITDKYSVSNMIQLDNGSIVIAASDIGSTSKASILFVNTEGEIQKTVVIDGNGRDYISNIMKTSDGGFVVFGETRSTDLGVDISSSGLLVVKYNSNGDMVWKKGIEGYFSSYVTELSDGTIAMTTIHRSDSMVSYRITKLNKDTGDVIYQSESLSGNGSTDYETYKTYNAQILPLKNEYYAIVSEISQTGNSDDRQSYVTTFNKENNVVGIYQKDNLKIDAASSSKNGIMVSGLSNGESGYAPYDYDGYRYFMELIDNGDGTLSRSNIRINNSLTKQDKIYTILNIKDDEYILSGFNSSNENELWGDIDNSFPLMYIADFSASKPIIGANDGVIKVGEEFKISDFFTCYDKNEGDITDKLKIVSSDLKTDTPGDYKVQVKVTNNQGATSYKTANIEVIETRQGTLNAPAINVNDNFSVDIVDNKYEFFNHYPIRLSNNNWGISYEEDAIYAPLMQANGSKTETSFILNLKEDATLTLHMDTGVSRSNDGKIYVNEQLRAETGPASPGGDFVLALNAGTNVIKIEAIKSSSDNLVNYNNQDRFSVRDIRLGPDALLYGYDTVNDSDQIKYKIDNGEWLDYNGSISIEGSKMKEGVTIYSKAIYDSIESNVAQKDIRIDDYEILSPSIVLNKETFELDVVDNGVLFKNSDGSEGKKMDSHLIEYKIDNSEWKTYESPIELIADLEDTQLYHEQHTMQVRAIFLGEYSNVSTYDFRYVSVPEIQDVGDKVINQGEYKNILDGIYAYDKTDGDISNNVKYKIEGLYDSSENNDAFSGQITEDMVGDYKITYFVQNSAGITVSTKTYNLKILPNLQITEPYMKQTYNEGKTDSMIELHGSKAFIPKDSSVLSNQDWLISNATKDLVQFTSEDVDYEVKDLSIVSEKLDKADEYEMSITVNGDKYKYLSFNTRLVKDTISYSECDDVVLKVYRNNEEVSTFTEWNDDSDKFIPLESGDNEITFKIITEKNREGVVAHIGNLYLRDEESSDSYSVEPLLYNCEDLRDYSYKIDYNDWKEYTGKFNVSDGIKEEVVGAKSVNTNENTLRIAYKATYEKDGKVYETATKEGIVGLNEQIKPILNVEPIVLYVNQHYDLLDYATAYDKDGTDISSSIQVKSTKVDISNVGSYEVIYKVVGKTGEVATKKQFVRVLPRLVVNKPEIHKEDRENKNYISLEDKLMLKKAGKIAEFSNQAWDYQEGVLTSVKGANYDTNAIVVKLNPDDEFSFDISSIQSQSMFEVYDVSDVDDVENLKLSGLTDEQIKNVISNSNRVDIEHFQSTNEDEYVSANFVADREGYYLIRFAKEAEYLSTEENNGYIEIKNMKLNDVSFEDEYISSTKMMYKINDGDWKDYNGEIDLSEENLVFEDDNKINIKAKSIYTDGDKLIESEESEYEFEVELASLEVKNTTIIKGSNIDKLELITAKDVDGKDITDSAEVVFHNVNNNEVGQYLIRYKIKGSNGYSIIKEVNVEVVNTPPEIIANDVSIYTDDDFDALDYVTAYDEQEGDIDKSRIEVVSNNVDNRIVGEYEVTYKVVDLDGAEVIKAIKVVVNERPLVGQAPTIVFPNIQVGLGNLSFNEKDGVTAYDVEDGDITHKIEILDSKLNVNEVGEYEVVYSVVDSDKNRVVVTRVITVIENINYDDEITTLPDDVPVDTDDVPTILPDDVPVDTTDTPTILPDDVPVDTTDTPTILPDDVPVDTTDTPTILPDDVPVDTIDTPTILPDDVPVDTDDIPTILPDDVPVDTTDTPTILPDDVPVEDDNSNIGSNGNGSNGNSSNKEESSNTNTPSTQKPQTGDSGVIVSSIVALLSLVGIKLVNKDEEEK